MQPICDLCFVYVGSVAHCFPCAKVVRRNAALGRWAKAALALALVAAAIGFAMFHEGPFDYGQHRAAVMKAREKIVAERCDRSATIEYEEALLRSGDNRGTLADVDGFIAKCGDWYRVHWTAYTAHQRLSEHLAAVTEAGKLVDHRPDDADYRWWRGLAYEEGGQIDQAILDYRMSIQLNPRITNIPFNLADLLERQGKRCESLAVVEAYVAEYPRESDDQALVARLKRLRTGDVCGRAK